MASLRDTIGFTNELELLLENPAHAPALGSLAVSALYLGNSEQADRIVHLALERGHAIDPQFYRQRAQNTFGPDRSLWPPDAQRLMDILEEWEEECRALH